MSPLLPSPTVSLRPRQIWAVASETASSSLSDCYAYRIRSGWTLMLENSTSLNLTGDAFLRPPCGSEEDPDAERPVLDSAILDVRDPYFASASPVLFVLAMCLTVAWVLLLVLMIHPRTFYHGGSGYGIGQMRSGSSGGSMPLVGVGSRPWFQKVATLTVAVSLLLATVRTFGVASDQYNKGFQDSLVLTLQTLDSMEVRVVRFVSTVFEWLAQAQTSLRLFQRPREKVVIKWVALSLIGLEMVFGILNNFTTLGDNDEGLQPLRPRHYDSAIPALQYLFEIALSLMYAAVVLYYSATKRRFAYYHPKMKNISLVALLAVVAVLVPIVFFICDIAVPTVASWGDYVRWVGAAAASVIVWEWVERIEALERDERKDGILGREIFEGDEMLDNGPGPDGVYKSKKRRLNKTESSDTTLVETGSERRASRGSNARRSGMSRPRFTRLDKNLLAKIAAMRTAKKTHGDPSVLHNGSIELTPAPRALRHRERVSKDDSQLEPTNARSSAQIPPTTSSPVSRSDCTSASTVYRIVHHPISPTSTPGISETLYPQGHTMNVASPSPELDGSNKRSSGLVRQRALDIANLKLFKRRGANTSPDTLETASDDGCDGDRPTDQVRSEADKKSTKHKLFSRLRRNHSDNPELPPLVIPWRGDDAVEQANFDLESGLVHGRTDQQHEVTHTRERGNQGTRYSTDTGADGRFSPRQHDFAEQPRGSPPAHSGHVMPDSESASVRHRPP